MMSATETCLLVARQAVFRWHEFYLGLDKELGKLPCHVKRKVQWEQPRGRIAMGKRSGGSIRSSYEASVMEVERRVRVAQFLNRNQLV